MKTDILTTTALWLITLLLSILVLKPLFQPAPALAQSPAGTIQVGPNPQGAFTVFDSRTGDIWIYGYPKGEVMGHLKLTKPGAPLDSTPMDGGR